MPNNENENLKVEDDSPSAAAGSEALWETTTTLKEDLLNGEKLLREGLFENRGPIILSPAEYENYKKLELIKEP